MPKIDLGNLTLDETKELCIEALVELPDEHFLDVIRGEAERRELVEEIAVAWAEGPAE